MYSMLEAFLSVNIPSMDNSSVPAACISCRGTQLESFKMATPLSDFPSGYTRIYMYVHLQISLVGISFPR